MNTTTATTAPVSDAPAYALLATHCACCGRPLKDSVSVTRGIGPECFGKYYPAGTPAIGDEAWDAIDELLLGALALVACLPLLQAARTSRDNRALSNVAVLALACDPRTTATEALLQLVTLCGFERVAERVHKRLAGWLTRSAPRVVRPERAVEIERGAERYTVRVRGLDTIEFAAFLGAIRDVPGRVYVRAERASTFPLTSRGALWAALRESVPGVALEINGQAAGVVPHAG